jgi:hypothetical protein
MHAGPRHYSLYSAQGKTRPRAGYSLKHFCVSGWIHRQPNGNIRNYMSQDEDVLPGCAVQSLHRSCRQVMAASKGSLLKQVTCGGFCCLQKQQVHWRPSNRQEEPFGHGGTAFGSPSMGLSSRQGCSVPVFGSVRLLSQYWISVLAWPQARHQYVTMHIFPSRSVVLGVVVVPSAEVLGELVFSPLLGEPSGGLYSAPVALLASRGTKG